MIRLAEARHEVCRRAAPLAAEQVAIEDALGRVLGEDIASDIDAPPFDKACMDGFAVRAEEASREGTRFRVLEEITAGHLPSQLVAPGTASRIMTGAPMPAGADAVVISEQSQAEGHEVCFSAGAVRPGQHVQPRGSCLQQGQVVLRAGDLLSAAAIGLLAEVGRATVPVLRKPRVGVLVTGDELVAASQRPGPGQIRNSNGPLLMALAAAHGGVPVPLGVGRDALQDLSQRVARGLENDLLLMTGGVSAGSKDLVPQVLSNLGVQAAFHKVAIKPGKPIWFGSRQQTLIFGLPGNPVSCLVGFLLLVRPVLDILRGRRPPLTAAEASRGGPATPGDGRWEMPAVGCLAHAHRFRGDRETYLPGRAVGADQPHEPPRVTLLPWQGSADLLTVAQANVLVEFPPGDREYQPGERVGLLSL